MGDMKGSYIVIRKGMNWLGMLDDKWSWFKSPKTPNILCLQIKVPMSWSDIGDQKPKTVLQFQFKTVGRGPIFGLRSWVWERCGPGGEDSQEFEIFIFGSKCPPTTATTITAIMTTTAFSIQLPPKLTKEMCCSFNGLYRLLHLCIKPLLQHLKRL